MYTQSNTQLRMGISFVIFIFREQCHDDVLDNISQTRSEAVDMIVKLKQRIGLPPGWKVSTDDIYIYTVKQHYFVYKYCVAEIFL